MKTKYSQSVWSSLLALAVLIGVSVGCQNWSSRAKGRVIERSCESDVGIVNGEMDYGVTVKLRIKNVGAAGELKITSVISTSEGKWQKTQALIFDPGEEANLTYFFHEPTINARNVQCQFGLSPQAD